MIIHNYFSLLTTLTFIFEIFKLCKISLALSAAFCVGNSKTPLNLGFVSKAAEALLRLSSCFGKVVMLTFLSIIVFVSTSNPSNLTKLCPLGFGLSNLRAGTALFCVIVSENAPVAPASNCSKKLLIFP